MGPLRCYRLLGALLAVVLSFSSAPAQTQTVGLFRNDPGSFDGYTLFAPQQYEVTYLIDNDGLVVHTWDSPYRPGQLAYLLETGHLLRPANPMGNDVFMAGGAAGIVQELDWDGNLVWEFVYSDSTVRAHHDVEAMPNGNVLVVAWEYKSEAEAVQAGRDPATMPGNLWPDHIIEIQPDGFGGADIVWEWHSWDHLIQDFDATKDNHGVVADHPELIDINYRESDSADWLHFNAIAYNADLDQIVVSPRTWGEFWIIDHGTTTQEAAGHTGGACGMGGDILYRWGNPRAYRAGTPGDQVFWSPHDPHWIADGLTGAGRMMVFNDGRDRPEGPYSTVEEIVTTVDSTGCYPQPSPGTPHGPAAPAWIYPAVPDTSFYARARSNAQRLPNGNTLICESSPATLFEVDPAENVVWEYVVPVNADGPMYQYWTSIVPGPTFRTYRYAPDSPAFDGRDLTPGGPIELDPTFAVGTAGRADLRLRAAPNPFRGRSSISFALEAGGDVRLDVYDVRGRLVSRLIDQPLAAGLHRHEWRPGRLPSGVYHYVLRAGEQTEARKVVHLE
ncbi:aryl-sulfate sulfotransferase [bacterium]|nr:aryl-sulfate sulfotransferase [bacterium]